MEAHDEGKCSRKNRAEKKLELALLCPKGFKGNVTSARPTRLQDAIKLTNSLMDQKIRIFAARQAENKRRLESNPRENCVQQPPYKRRNVARAYTVGSGEKREYDDCRKAKIAVGERITRSVFGVKGVNLGDEESPYWTMIGKKESYKPRPSSDGVGAQTPYYARKRILRCLILLGEWKISRDDEINPFKDVLVFRRMVEFLGAIPINLKSNMWESEDLIENPINWDKPPKDGDGAWHAKIWIIDPDGEEFVKTLQSIPTNKKLSERKNSKGDHQLGPLL
ncbi:hypothetical protein Tco_0439615 [Tanacetum coccineum]